MTKEQEKIKKAVEYLKNYINTYDTQLGYMDYSDECFIDDILYGLGVSLDAKNHSFAGGFMAFKMKLLAHLQKRC
jgi:hypothetical protein